MDRSTISTVGGKERLALVMKETSSEPLPTLRKVSTKLMRSLESISALSSFISSVTDVAHIHPNKTMLPLTPATPQRTCSRLKESKCLIGRLAARTSI
uniref:Uncharacterized protein n=1 Tax=Caenorhabditis japonica TaxID=281687 RepID=A0A8R1IE94_CAEJA